MSRSFDKDQLKCRKVFSTWKWKCIICLPCYRPISRIIIPRITNGLVFLTIKPWRQVKPGPWWACPNLANLFKCQSKLPIMSPRKSLRFRVNQSNKFKLVNRERDKLKLLMQKKLLSRLQRNWKIQKHLIKILSSLNKGPPKFKRPRLQILWETLLFSNKISRKNQKFKRQVWLLRD